MEILSIVIITSALVLYSIGVWAERIQRTLKGWHVGFFLAGLACDATGTWLMSRIAAAGTASASGPLMGIMAVTGAVALLLMAGHAAWAVVVLLRNRASEKRRFHLFSLAVWAIWLVPYFTGAAGAMLR